MSISFHDRRSGNDSEKWSGVKLFGNTLSIREGNAFFIKNFLNLLTFLVKTAIIYEKSTFCWEKEMRAFDYVALKDQKWDSEIVAYIAAIHEAKGKQKLYLKHAPHNIL